MAEDLSYQLIGKSAQVLEVNLEPNKTIIADGGALLYIDEEITFGLRDNDGADEFFAAQEPEPEPEPEEEPLEELGTLEDEMPEEEEFEDEPQREGSLLEKLFVAGKKAIQQVSEKIKKTKEEEDEDEPEEAPPFEEPEEEMLEEPEEETPSWYITHFSNETEYVRKVAFTTAHTGQVLAIDLESLKATSLIIQTGTFLCAALGTRLAKFSDSTESVTFTKEKYFNLDEVKGDGLLFLRVEGQAIEKELEDDAIRVNLFSLVAFEDTLEVNITQIKYLESMRYEDKTQFVLLTGTGKYWLQAANIQHEVYRISPFVFEPPVEDGPNTDGDLPYEEEAEAPPEIGGENGSDEADELFEKLGEKDPE